MTIIQIAEVVGIVVITFLMCVCAVGITIFLALIVTDIKAILNSNLRSHHEPPL